MPDKEISENLKLDTPVAFFIFNRPDTTQKVFNEIKKAKPPIMLVVADGARNPGEEEKCRAARAIIEQVDWDCDVRKNYSDKNLGCKGRVSSGLDWVFENVDRCIILEDDCLPHQSFFYFCQELLEKYKNNERIMHITGDNFQSQNASFQCKESYYFSRISHIWGWASWRRAWKHYDLNIRDWPKIKESGLLRKLFRDDGATARWEEKFDAYHEGKIDSWDGQWSFACMANNGLCIVPKVNLISNIGFDVSATHSSNLRRDRFANLPAFPIEFPLIHPNKIEANEQADRFTQEYVFGAHNYRGVGQRFRRFIRKIMPGPYKALKNLLRR